MSIPTWKHGDTPCLYPHRHIEILHVHIHMETWRHSVSIFTQRLGDTHGDMETLHIHIHMETW